MTNVYPGNRPMLSDGLPVAGRTATEELYVHGGMAQSACMPPPPPRAGWKRPWFGRWQSEADMAPATAICGMGRVRLRDVVSI
ncbi:hypothetical protein X744_14850 [Mesorhizobium sp. LNJC372A00]|nr:hypothetical protein X744_14850 [Mesorhizobium sp. LNJC372A00]